MDQIGFEAVVITLIEKMRERGSWCSGTHLQKAMFFLQEMMHVPTGLKFVLYKHGPYSFDLQPAINSMLADQILSLQINDPGYGPSLVKGSNVEVVTKRSEEIIKEYLPKIEFIAEKFASKNVAELEREGTAFLVYSRENLGDDEEAIAFRISKLKPHVSVDNAKAAFQEIKKIKDQAASL